MKKIIAALFPFLFASLSAGAAPGYDIIIALGNSNSMGRGFGPFTDKAASEVVDARIFQLGRFDADDMQVVPVGFTDANGVKWDGLQHWSKPPGTTGMGHALTFARWYVRKRLASDRSVIIIPCGYGKTSVLHWEKNWADLPLFSDLVARLNAVKLLPGNSPVVALLMDLSEVEMLWASTTSAANMTPDLFKSTATQFFQSIRLKIPSAPLFPIIANRPAPSWYPPSPSVKAPMEGALLAALATDPLARAIDTRGLTTNTPSNVHFNAQSQVTVGARMFHLYSVMVP